MPNPAHQPAATSKPNGSQPIFFFNEREQHGFLSQWYPCTFNSHGLQFNCAEQFMLWSEAQSAGDARTAAEILSTDSPTKQKALGKQVRNFDVKEWDRVKSAVVEQGNYLKFTQCDRLRELLWETYNKELVEASHFDRVWGIGYGVKDAGRTPREKWGQNLLGQAIMAVRERIRREEEDGGCT